MSVEKLSDASKTILDGHPYTMICNKVLEQIKDNDAFRLYCYLASKSREWVVIKEWTAKVCGVGERKAKQCWSYLERCGLIKYIQARDENGKYLKHDVRVLHGTEFNPDEPFLKSSGAETAPVEKLSTDDPSHRCKNAVGGVTARADSARLLKKDCTKKDFDRKKEKSSCATAQKLNIPQKPKSRWREDNAKRHAFADKMDAKASGDEQMKREAKHIEESNERKAYEAEQVKRTPMPDSLRNMVNGLKRAGYGTRL